MFKQKTLFVVGAGGSAEYSFPTGSKLAARISEKLDIKYDDWGDKLISGDAKLWSQIQHTQRTEIGRYQEAARLIRDGVHLSSSIDDFLDVHAADQIVLKVGKAAIVRSILEAERGSSLFYDRSNAYNILSFADIEGTWLTRLFRMLGRGVPPESAKNIFNNIGFVIFNYDRCIEHFLFNALKQFYKIDDRQAGELIRSLWICHPYGVVAPLPWMTHPGVDFGGNDNSSSPYLNLADRIKTYTEQIDDQTQIEEIRNKISEADKIIYLGFAFHDQNLQLLKPVKALQSSKEIFGTGFGMSDSDIKVTKQQLLEFFNHSAHRSVSEKIILENKHKCADIFEHYAKSLPA